VAASRSRLGQVHGLSALLSAEHASPLCSETRYSVAGEDLSDIQGNITERLSIERSACGFVRKGYDEDDIEICRKAWPSGTLKIAE
jgi:hypothetical protein